MRVASVVGLFLTVCTAIPVHAQAPVRNGAQDDNDRFTVVVVLVDRLPDPAARSRAIRRADQQPQNVLLITPAATEGDVARGMAALAASHAKFGKYTSRTMSTNIGAGRPLRGAAAQPKREAIRRVLEHLSRGQLTDVPGIGRVPAIVYPTRISDWGG